MNQLDERKLHCWIERECLPNHIRQQLKKSCHKSVAACMWVIGAAVWYWSNRILEWEVLRSFYSSFYKLL